MDDMAPSMGVKVPSMASELAHCHVMSVMSPSGSVTMAVNSTPTCGCVADRLAVPSSSTFVTVMVTVAVAVRLCGSVAVTITV